jgi:hypothetical protein
VLLGESAVTVISPRSFPAPFLWLLLAAIAFSSAPLKAQTRAINTLNAPQRIAALIEPAKLATLAARGANPRVQKYVAQMEEARQSGQDPEQVAAEAVRLTGMTGDAATLTLEAMLRNLTIAQRLGCLTPEGLAEMRRGRSPTITLGPYAGDQLSVDHIIPFSLAPTLDKVIANLELMPLKMNIRKRDAMGERQQALALRLRRAGLF